VAYLAATGEGGVFAVVDAAGGKAYPDIVAASLQFSPDSQRAVYVVRSNDPKSPSLAFDPKGPVVYSLVDGPVQHRWYVFIDVGGISFDHRGRVVYLGSTQCETIDGDPSHAYAQVIEGREANLLWEEGRAIDGPCQAHAVMDGPDQRVMVNGELGPIYTSVADVRISPDGQHVAYRAVDLVKGVQREFIVLDDTEIIQPVGRKIVALTFRGPRVLGVVMHADDKVTRMSMAIGAADE